MMTMLLMVLAVALAMIAIELIFPAWKRALDHRWLLRALLFNTLQAATAMVGAITWDSWFSTLSVIERGTLSGVTGIVTGYLLITFVYYWWHRARHEVPVFWLFLHRVHHSPSRLEILTTFYKHPVELVLNGLLTSALLYFLLGLEPAIVTGVVLLTGLAELFYHWNIRTPRWIGWFLQRPESHRVHHARGWHTRNFSDLPVWDALFGTLRQSQGTMSSCCGFVGRRSRSPRCCLAGSVREVMSRCVRTPAHPVHPCGPLSSPP